MGCVLLTGAAGGIGTAISADLIAAGRVVVGLDRERVNGASESHVLNVADEIGMTETVGGIVARHTQIDALICASGSVSESEVANMSLAAWQSVIDASLTGTFLAARAALPSMIAARGGSIVAFSSGYATSGYKNGANYAAAKAGVEALMKSIALENAQFGVRANCIAPGPITTPMLKPERAAVIAPRVPMQRVGEVQDILGTVRFLIGGESVYITGQTIHVNGGLLMP